MKFDQIKNFVITYSKKILGILLIMLGIIGLFLPFLQGILMIIAGLVLVGNHALLVTVRRFVQKLKILWHHMLVFLRLRGE